MDFVQNIILQIISIVKDPLTKANITQCETQNLCLRF